jgi:hypothetical protein
VGGPEFKPQCSTNTHIHTHTQIKVDKQVYGDKRRKAVVMELADNYVPWKGLEDILFIKAMKNLPVRSPPESLKS